MNFNRIDTINGQLCNPIEIETLYVDGVDLEDLEKELARIKAYAAERGAVKVRVDYQYYDYSDNRYVAVYAYIPLTEEQIGEYNVFKMNELKAQQDRERAQFEALKKKFGS